jgi:hypothetical protein
MLKEARGQHLRAARGGCKAEPVGRGAIGRGGRSIRAASDFVIPFIKINSNQIRQALERSPAGIAMPAIKQIGRKGLKRAVE